MLLNQKEATKGKTDWRGKTAKHLYIPCDFCLVWKQETTESIVAFLCFVVGIVRVTWGRLSMYTVQIPSEGAEYQKKLLGARYQAVKPQARQGRWQLWHTAYLLPECPAPYPPRPSFSYHKESGLALRQPLPKASCHCEVVDISESCTESYGLQSQISQAREAYLVWKPSRPKQSVCKWMKKINVLPALWGRFGVLKDLIILFYKISPFKGTYALVPWPSHQCLQVPKASANLWEETTMP